MNGIVVIVYLAVLVLLIAGNWMVFTKANEAGWKSIIPIWNAIVLLRIIGRPVWWIVLLLIPFVNIVVLIIVWRELARSFGKDVGFTVGLFFLPFIFLPMLGFGGATYRGPNGAGIPAVATA
ncbi:MAG TPA: DUF5684 domain-containing protein [Gaiellaceae bacterium]|jgi:hypothetical protein|nr:DUF5684 domain-containing protein [Gaiellaceae bacterium]